MSARDGAVRKRVEQIVREARSDRKFRNCRGAGGAGKASRFRSAFRRAFRPPRRRAALRRTREFGGAGEGLGSPAYFRSMPATVWRSWASCSLIFIKAPVIRLLFALPCSILEHSAQSICSSPDCSRFCSPRTCTTPGCCGRERICRWRRRCECCTAARSTAISGSTSRRSCPRSICSGARGSVRCCASPAHSTHGSPACLGYALAAGFWSRREGYCGGGAARLLSDVRYAFGDVAAGGRYAAACSASRRCAAGFAPSILLERGRGGDRISVQRQGRFRAGGLRAFCVAAAVIPLLAGFAVPNLAALGWLLETGALTPYIDQVWRWPAQYAGSPIVADPVWNGVVRTCNWLGFHAVLVIGAAIFWLFGKRWKFIAWAADLLCRRGAGLALLSAILFPAASRAGDPGGARTVADPQPDGDRGRAADDAGSAGPLRPALRDAARTGAIWRSIATAGKLRGSRSAMRHRAARFTSGDTGRRCTCIRAAAGNQISRMPGDDRRAGRPASDADPKSC